MGKFLVFSFLFLNLISHAADNRDIKFENFFDAKKLTIKDITQYKNRRAIIHFDGIKQDYWCSNKTIDAFASHDVVNITYAGTSLGACIQDWILEIDFDEALQSHADLLSKKLYYFLISRR